MKKTIALALMAPFCLAVITSCQKSVSGEDDASRNPEMQKSGNATVWTQTIQLRGENEVPPNDLGAHGVAILRVTADKVLHSKIIVQMTEEAGMLTAAHVHEGPAGANGPVRIFLAHNVDDFGINRTLQLTDEQYNILMNNPTYVNAHSTVKPGGIVRGQIR